MQEAKHFKNYPNALMPGNEPFSINSSIAPPPVEICEILSKYSFFEIAASGKASILIPITDSAADHNRRNAYVFAENGRAEVIEEANLTPNLLLSVINSILNNPEKKKSMEEKAKKFSTPEAAKLIAQALLNLIPK